jgi:hypothetical protein
MTTTKQTVESMLTALPEDCSIEDIQYHLYVLGKVRQGLQVADTETTVRQDEAEDLLGKWLIE